MLTSKALLIFSVLAQSPQPTTDDLQVPPAGLGKAPRMPAWPSYLPEAKETKDGTFLPARLSKHVKRRLMYGEAYPQMCQVSIDVFGDFMWRAAQSRSEEETLGLRSELETLRDQQWDWLDWVMVVGSALALGAATGATLTAVSR